MNSLSRLTAMIIALFVTPAPLALACSCSPCDEQTSFVRDKNTRSAFVGELVSVTKPNPETSEEGEIVYRFRVLRSLKGNTSKFVDVLSQEMGASCGASFTFYMPNAVAAYGKKGEPLRTSSCSQLCWGTDVNTALIPEQTLQTWRWWEELED